MNNNIKLISIIIPVRNEATIIEQNLQHSLNFFNALKIPYELLVVDSASTDETPIILKKFIDRIKIITLTQPGKGRAIKAGVLQAKGDWILFYDADLSTPLEEICNFLPAIYNFDIIIGSRALERKFVTVHQVRWKELLGRAGNFLIQLVLGLKIKDTQCGFKLFNRRSAEIFSELKNNNWGFDFEFLYLAKKKGLRIKELPVRWSNRSQSQVKKSDYLRVCAEVFKVRFGKK